LRDTPGIEELSQQGVWDFIWLVQLALITEVIGTTYKNLESFLLLICLPFNLTVGVMWTDDVVTPAPAVTRALKEVVERLKLVDSSPDLSKGLEASSSHGPKALI
jgi:hypothetical protein